MNIPLINTNDKESINTSLIAIKRATEELNNLIKIADEKMAQLDEKAKKYTDDKINALDVASVGGSGKYISAISETNGKISATESDITSTVSSGNSQPVTSGGVAEAFGKIKQIAGTNLDVNNCYIDELVNATTFYNISQRETLIPNTPDIGMGANFNIVTFQEVYVVRDSLRLIQVAIPQTGGSTSFANKIFVRQGYKDLGSEVQWGNWELQSLPIAPTTDGTYDLQCSVVNGASTLKWEEGLYYKDFSVDCSYTAGAVGSRGNQVLKDASVSGYSIVSFRIQYIVSSNYGIIVPFLNSVDSQLYINTYRTVTDAVTNSCIIRVYYKKGTINTFPSTRSSLDITSGEEER